MRIQLLYSPVCPHVEEARGILRRCLQEVGITCSVEEIDTSERELPAALRSWGSPTILVDGIDVAGMAMVAQGESCRIYANGRGVPTPEQILGALQGPRTAMGGGEP